MCSLLSSYFSIAIFAISPQMGIWDKIELEEKKILGCKASSGKISFKYSLLYHNRNPSGKISFHAIVSLVIWWATKNNNGLYSF